MERDWMEYQCKSGRTVFLYNKVTGEHRLPHELASGTQGKIIYGRQVIYKELRNTATQTDDNGCNNGCMSTFINPSQFTKTSDTTLPTEHTDEDNPLNSSPADPRSILTVKDPRGEHEGQAFRIATFVDEHVLENNCEGHSTDGDTKCSHCEIDHIETIMINICEKDDVNDDNDDGVGKNICIQIADNDKNDDYGNNDDDDKDDNNDDEDDYDDDNDSNAIEDSCVKNESKDEFNDEDGKDDAEKMNQDLSEDIDSNDDMVVVPISVHAMDDNISYTENETHEETQSKVKLFECSLCKVKLSSKQSLDRHLRIHLKVKPYECSFCKKTFRTSGNLKLHLRIHTNEKPYECNICQKKFTQKIVLKRHLIMHTGDKPYECTVCGKKFTRKSSQVLHQSQHNEVVKPYECTVCKKRFTQKSNLNSHVSRIHTGFKPFECTVCNKKFARKDILVLHSNQHTNVKPFECTVCGKKFSWRTSLDKHVKCAHVEPVNVTC